MPSGRTHAVITAITTPIMTVGGLYWGVKLDYALLFAAGSALGIMISPDLDLDEGNISVDILRRKSPIAAFLWRAYWWPYAKFMIHRGGINGKRSPRNISHFPILGTFSRFVLVLLPIWGIQLAFNQTLWTPGWRTLCIFVGLCASDLWHILADIVVSDVKRNRRRRIDNGNDKQYTGEGRRY